jgi:hypothetical protein
MHILKVRPVAEKPSRRPRRGAHLPPLNAEMLAVFHSIKHNRPYGSDAWTARIEKRLGIGPLRKRGRPKVEKTSGN